MALSRSRMEQLLQDLQKPLREAVIKAVQAARSRANIAAMERAIITGSFEDLLQAAGIRDGMWSHVTEAYRGAYAEAGAVIMAGDVPARFGMIFNITNPRAEAWLKKHSAQLVTGDLAPQQIGAIQEALLNGMIRGDNPRTTALDIVGRISKTTGRRSGGVIGLTKNQSKFVSNAREDLETLNPRYFDRKLRDKRFDKMVRKSFVSGQALPKATQEKIIGRYEDRMLKHRGDNIARTEALGALNAAADEALEQIVEEGLAPANAVKRIWKHSFNPNHRPGHFQMGREKQERGIGEYFTNPITGALLKHPGDGDASEVVNCTCYLEHKIDFFAVERRAA